MSVKASWVVFGISILINALLVAYILHSSPSSASQYRQKKEVTTDYPFLSKRIFAENQNDMLINFTALRNELNDYYTQRKHRIGVYFEYLPSGASIGVNEKEEFFPASLLKVPLAMETYHQISLGNIDGNTTLTIKPQDLNEASGDLYKKGVGYKMTVFETIKYMIIHSDNTAVNMLLDIVPEKEVNDVFNELDIPMPQENHLTVITPKNYSSMLRSLYLSTYISKKYSNELLKYLSETVYTDKLPAGVPTGIKVSHKIGILKNESISKSELYSDCGIVFVPLRPYALCIMVEGNEDTARNIIIDISKRVYAYVTKDNPN